MADWHDGYAQAMEHTHDTLDQLGVPREANGARLYIHERIRALRRPPEGWKLVPVTPTPEMRDAAVQAICYGPEGGFTRTSGPDRAWSAMLGAVLNPPLPRDEGADTSGEPRNGCGAVGVALPETQQEKKA